MVSGVRNKPSYAITSVDHALHLALMLQQEGPMRVVDAAERLGVSVSTAHRLLSMLVYRDFASQDVDRRYRAGSVLNPATPSEAPTALLRRLAMPHLQRLVDQHRESANLMVLAGDQARIIATVEANQVLRVGDRAGRTLPAHLTSGGRAVLATLPPAEITRRYAGVPDVDLARLRRDLGLVRRRGFAINDQRTEKGVTAIGVPVHDRTGEAVAAIALAIPTARFDRDRLPVWVSALSAAAEQVTAELSSAG